MMATLHVEAAMISPGMLHTDLYQLTMAQAYWHCGRADEQAVFHLYYRKPPPGSACVLACGQTAAATWAAGLSLCAEQADYLRDIPGSTGQPLFHPGFVDWLRTIDWRCDIDAVPEGTAVFPSAPILRVTGPLAQAQLLETALLNAIGMPSLVATQAAHLAREAGDSPVLDFGLRSAQGPDGGLSASRAAYIGGCAATSNVLAGQRFGIPVKGTHAHAWVMSFDEEQAAFEAYADSAPDDTILLVDTYDSRRGIQRAIATGRRMQAQGRTLSGIRLDSGDLNALSRYARQALDDADLQNTRIVASGDLTPDKIAALRAGDAPINAWGVGSNLATGGPAATLDVVYKLGATRSGDAWIPRLKLSDSPSKQSVPGVLSVRRFVDHDRVYDADLRRPDGGADLLRALLRGQTMVAESDIESISRLARAQARQYLRDQAHTVQLDEPVQHRMDALAAERTA